MPPLEIICFCVLGDAPDFGEERRPCAFDPVRQIEQRHGMFHNGAGAKNVGANLLTQ